MLHALAFYFWNTRWPDKKKKKREEREERKKKVSPTPLKGTAASAQLPGSLSQSICVHLRQKIGRTQFISGRVNNTCESTAPHSTHRYLFPIHLSHTHTPDLSCQYNNTDPKVVKCIHTHISFWSSNWKGR